MSTDFNRAAMLLHIVDTCRQWPELQGLHDLAMAELREIAGTAKDELTKKRDAEAKKLADDLAKKRTEEIEANAKVVTPPVGPANSAYQDKNAQARPVSAPQHGIPNTTTGKTDSNTGEPLSSKAERLADSGEPMERKV